VGVSDVGRLVERQVEYLAEYSGIMMGISSEITAIDSCLADRAIRLGEIHPASYSRETVEFSLQPDAPQWFQFYFYRCRSPWIKSVSIDPYEVAVSLVCGGEQYDVRALVNGSVPLWHFAVLAGLPEGVWDAVLDRARGICDATRRNLEVIHEAASLLRDAAFSAPRRSVSPYAPQYPYGVQAAKTFLSSLADVFERVARGPACDCLDSYDVHVLLRDLASARVRVVPGDPAYVRIRSALRCDRAVSVPGWLSEVRKGRQYDLLRGVTMRHASVILHVEYREDGGGGRGAEDVFLVDRGQAHFGDLVLAGYILGDDVWERILGEAAGYLMLAREARVMVEERVVPAAMLLA
jgi:hypothetical protein